MNGEEERALAFLSESTRGRDGRLQAVPQRIAVQADLADVSVGVGREVDLMLGQHELRPQQGEDEQDAWQGRHGWVKKRPRVEYTRG